MNKYIKIGLVFGVVMGIIFLLDKVTETPLSEKINKILINNEYKYIDNNNYEKNISKINKEMYERNKANNIDSVYEYNLFNMEDYTLNKTIFDYHDNIETSLIISFNYKDENIYYTYRIDSDNINVVYRGSKKDEFVCNKEFSYGVFANNFENTICDSIKIQINNFDAERLLLIPNATIINEIKKK